MRERQDIERAYRDNIPPAERNPAMRLIIELLLDLREQNKGILARLRSVDESLPKD